MKFGKINKISKFLAITLVAAGCGALAISQINKDKEIKIVPKENIVDTNAGTVEAKVKEKKVDDILNTLKDRQVESTITQLYNENELKLMDISNPEYKKLQLDYSALVYQRLLENNIDQSIILKELDNLLIEQQLPRGVSEEEYNYLFGNIGNVLSNEENVFMTYFNLAVTIEEYMSDEKLRLNEFNSYTSDSLREKFYSRYGEYPDPVWIYDTPKTK